jgi:uncharacterized protein (TIGR01370 family)
MTWLAYYSDQAPVEAFESYNLLVLDSTCHPPLSSLAANGKTILGYVSLGEVENYRPWFPDVQAEGILLKENPNWKGSFYIDVRDPRWTERVLNAIVPGILKEQFTGIFLDTLDNPVELERADPERHRGMRLAAASLVRRLRARFPGVTIMMNRAYELLPEVETDIDMLLAECVITTYNFRSGTYEFIPRAEYLEHRQILREAKKRRPSLRIFTLDYWNPSDHRVLRRIYRTQRANGFEPYVATIGLDRIVEEPPP